MLKPIPARILTHSVTFYVPTLDAWGNLTTPASSEENPQAYPVTHVCVQPVNETRKTKDNTEVDLTGICFADVRLSTPALDYWSLKNQAEEAGGDLTLSFGDQIFTVKTVDALVDDTGALHHWELGLI